MTMIFNNIHQLADYLNRANLFDFGEYFYEATDCGANISFLVGDVGMIPSGDCSPRARPEWHFYDIEGIKLGAIVEGGQVEIEGKLLKFPFSEVEVNLLKFPFSEAELDREIEYVEAEVERWENEE